MKKTKVKKQKTPKKQGCSLFLLLMLLALAPVVLATVILSTTSLHLTRTNLEGSVQTTLHVTADNLAKYCKENEITAMNASGYYEYLDSLKEEDLEMAILADGIPATTSIKNENDYRIREIPMDQDLVSGGGTEGYYDKNVVIDGNAYRLDLTGDSVSVDLKDIFANIKDEKQVKVYAVVSKTRKED